MRVVGSDKICATGSPGIVCKPTLIAKVGNNKGCLGYIARAQQRNGYGYSKDFSRFCFFHLVIWCEC